MAPTINDKGAIRNDVTHFYVILVSFCFYEEHLAQFDHNAKVSFTKDYSIKLIRLM